jgi:hypothetical protein
LLYHARPLAIHRVGGSASAGPGDLLLNSCYASPPRLIVVSELFLATKGVKVAALFVLFQQRVCGPLANNTLSPPAHDNGDAATPD